MKFARTEDGVNIAYFVTGEGPVLLMTPDGPVADFAAEWRVPEFAEFYQKLAERWTLVQYDRRGGGSSQRDVKDLSSEAWVRDLTAVAEVASPEPFILWGQTWFSPTAVTYAARNPSRVSRLVLFHGTPTAAALFRLPGTQAWIEMGKQDFQLVMDAWSRTYATGDMSDLFQTATTPEAFAAFMAPREDDAESDAASQVQAPALVLHRSESEFVPLHLGRELASLLLDAQFVTFPGREHFAFQGDSALVIEAFETFMGLEPRLSRDDRHVLRIIVFTDVEASTDLTDRFGDAKARDVLREHERLTREALARHGGTEVKTMGDGFLASFTSASGALDAAVAMQQSITDRFGQTETPIRIRVGINAGEPIEEDDDLYGTAVIRAARIVSAAEGGEILVSDLVRGLVAGKDYLFADRGEQALKGFEEPVRLFALRTET